MSYVYILARAPRTLIFVLCLVGVQRVEGVLKVTGRCLMYESQLGQLGR